MNLQFKNFCYLLLSVVLAAIFLWIVNPYSAYDLKLHYWLNQDRNPPAKIVIVALNEENIPKPNKIKSIHNWPRSSHARLINKLSQAGVSSITFDIFFSKKTSADALLVQAMTNSAKIFLVNKIELNWLKDKREVVAKYQRIVQPLAMLSASSVLTAPSVYAADNHGLYYQYLPVLDLLDQKMPQLPILLVCWELINDGAMTKYLQALQNTQNLTDEQAKQFKNLENILSEHHIGKFFLEFASQAKSQSDLFKRTLKSAKNLTLEQQQKLTGLIKIVNSTKKHVLNFLGKSSQYITLDYAEVLAGKHQTVFNNATVFVGLSSVFKQTQVDSFLTPASFDGVGQHGIYLLATAYDNIAHNNGIQKPSDWHLYIWLLLIMFLMLPIFFIRHYFIQGIFGFFVLTSYFIVSLYILAKMQIWLPLLIPLSVLFILWMGAMYINIRNTHHVKQRLSGILSGYLPQPAVNKLLANHGNKIIENSWGVCLVTDIRGFTSLSEQQAPDKVHKYLNRYYQLLIDTIHQHQGIVSDLIGDTMMALWVDKTPNYALKQKAVKAAFEIVTQVKKYNLEHSEFPLDTGIGIHVGDISLGSLGSETHFEYRPIGDMINTTARIESLNKIFHLPILVSDSFLADINDDNLATRFIGNILLSGKQVPVKLYSLEKKSQDLLNKFSKAMICLKEFNFKQARILFEDCVDNDADEASKIYLWLLEQEYINHGFNNLILSSWLDDYNKNRQHKH